MSRSNSMVTRRQFLAAAGAALPLVALPRPLLARPLAPRALSFVHSHTNERLHVEYFADGAYVPDALAEVDRLLRDFRTGDIHVIEPDLLDVLHQLADVTGARRPFQVISGYRSPATNSFLRQHSEGVAAGSLHMKGQAIDIRLADIPLSRLRSAAIALKHGGVGYYPASDFVHVDIGRVRTW